MQYCFFCREKKLGLYNVIFWMKQFLNQNTILNPMTYQYQFFIQIYNMYLIHTCKLEKRTINAFQLNIFITVEFVVKFVQRCAFYFSIITHKNDECVTTIEIDIVTLTANTIGLNHFWFSIFSRYLKTDIFFYGDHIYSMCYTCINNKHSLH